MFRELMRKHKQLSMEECAAMLKAQKRGVLSVLGDHDYPYGMPMNHWYEETDGCVYFHCGRSGHRLDALRQHDQVSFCVFDEGYREEGDWALNVKSVILFGRMEIIDDPELTAEMTRKLSYKFIQDEAHIEAEIRGSLGNTVLLKLTPEHVCGKLVCEK